MISYHGHQIAVATTGPDGSFRAAVAYPTKSRPRYQLRATDSSNHSAWTTGVPAPAMRVTVSRGKVRAIGDHFVPSGKVTITYHGQVVARTKTTDGAFDVVFPLPTGTHPKFALIATDELGRRVNIIGLGPKGVTARPKLPGRTP